MKNMSFHERKIERKTYYFKFVYGWVLIKCGACNGSPKCGYCNGIKKNRVQGPKSIGLNRRLLSPAINNTSP